MSDEVQRLDPVYGWEPAPPEPFWIRRWFRWRPACRAHGLLVFRDREAWEEHWMREHRGRGRP